MSTSNNGQINRNSHILGRSPHSSFSNAAQDLRLRSLPPAGASSNHAISHTHDATWRNSLRESGPAGQRPVTLIPSTNRSVRRIHDFALSHIQPAGLSSDHIRSNVNTLCWQNSLRDYPQRLPALIRHAPPVHHAHEPAPVVVVRLPPQSSDIRDVSGKKEATSPPPQERKCAEKESVARQASSAFSLRNVQEDPFFSRIIDPMIDKLIGLGRAKLREELELKEPKKDAQSDSESEEDWDIDISATSRMTKKYNISSEIVILQRDVLREINQHLGFPDLIKSAPYELGVGSITISEDETEHEKFDFISAIWKNKLRNLDAYIRRSLRILEEQQESILSNFLGKHPPFSQPIRMELEQLGAETHNEGQCVLKVTYYEGASRLGPIIYKPRSAETEIAILNMFSRLNELPLDKRTGPNLPVYKVISLENKECSIWEYVDAMPLSLPASDEIQHRIPNHQREEAEINLLRLYSISKHIGLTDLHQQNVLRKGAQLIPIDMEIIKKGAPTNLYSYTTAEPDPVPLTKEEEIIIKDFLRSHPHRLSRTVPVTTNILRKCSYHSKGYKVITSLVLKKLALTDTLINPPQIESKIKRNSFSGDAVFFTERDGITYYGVGKQKISYRKEDYATSSGSS